MGSGGVGRVWGEERSVQPDSVLRDGVRGRVRGAGGGGGGGAMALHEAPG